MRNPCEDEDVVAAAVELFVDFELDTFPFGNGVVALVDGITDTGAVVTVDEVGVGVFEVGLLIVV